MTKITIELTWERAVESYLVTLTHPGSKQKAKEIAMDEIRRLAREMDKLNGCELAKNKCQ